MVQAQTLVMWVVNLRRRGRSDLVRPLDPGSPAAPPPLQLLSHLPPVEPPRTLNQRDQETPRSHSPLSAHHPLPHFPQSSSPLHSLHFPFPLNLRSPAVLEPWLYSFDGPGHERARETPSLFHSSLEILYCWRASRHSTAWSGSPDSGIGKRVQTPAGWRC